MLEIIDKYQSVSFIGMSKNAGKTTTLNYFIDEARGKYTLGLSSIGRDGETVDRVTGTSKPRIYIYSGTIVTTAAACLKLSDATLEILEVTDISTPMGNIVISRAISDGYIELAGPSTNYQTKQVVEKMFGYGAKKVFVDGALSRKSFASPSVAEATILSTGASISSNYHKIVEETLHSYQLLTIDRISDEKILAQLWSNDHDVILFGEEKIQFQSDKTILGHEKEIVEQIDEDTKIIYTKGAITDSFVDHMLRTLPLKARPNLLVEDGTKLFLSRSNTSRLKTRGIQLLCVQPINVVGITVNPFSTHDYSVDPKMMISGLKKYINVPIFDVMDKG